MPFILLSFIVTVQKAKANWQEQKYFDVGKLRIKEFKCQQNLQNLKTVINMLAVLLCSVGV